MTEKDYENILYYIFNACKEYIKENNILLKNNQKVKAKMLCIPTQSEKREYQFGFPKYVIPKFGELDEIRIYDISYFRYEDGKSINIAGVNVLYYIVCLYLQLNGNKGVEFLYSAESDSIKSFERTKILKLASFIFNYGEEKFKYYPLNDIKGTGRFIFDLPPCI